MSNKQPSSSREPKRQLGTAAPKNHTCVRSFASVPAAVGGDLDRSIRSALADRTGLSRMHRDLDLQQRYGISVGAIRRYAKQLRAAGSLPADGSEVRTLAKRSPTAMPTTQRFQDTLSGHLFNALQRQLQDPDLPPEHLARLLTALSRYRQVQNYTQAQKIASSRYGRELAEKRKQDLRQRKIERERAARVKKLRGLLGRDARQIPDAVLEHYLELENLKMMDFSSPTPRPRPRATPPAPKGGTIADPHQAPPGPAAAPNP